MITITVSLPPDTRIDVIDAISVSVLDSTRDRQPRHTYLEGMDRTDPKVLELKFAV